MNANFYDIETFDNVFTLANFKEQQNVLEMYYLIDEPYRNLLTPPDNSWMRQAGDTIMKVNKNFHGKIVFYDLRNVYSAIHLVTTFGAHNNFEYKSGQNTNNPNYKSDYDTIPLYDGTNGTGIYVPKKHYMLNTPIIQHEPFRMVCDTDPEYKKNPDDYPYLFGYNSYNYDTTMYALLVNELFVIQLQPNMDPDNPSRIIFMPKADSARQLRMHNNDIFENHKSNMPGYLRYLKNKNNGIGIEDNIRKNMILSGRHLDVARLNEKQSKVALKRILGQLGYQIKESDKLVADKTTIENTTELCELFAYNTSDVVNLPNVLYHKAYYSSFELKKGLLRDYPELIYEKQCKAYAPDIKPERVRWNRLNIDSSSAQLATGCLCPYGHLTDIPVVSFDYPSENKAKELGIPRVNILEETRNFMIKTFPPYKYPEIQKRFNVIYNYYKSIEGHNYNNSENFENDYRFNAEILRQYPNLLNEMGENAKVLSQVPIPAYDPITGDIGDATWFPYFNGNGQETSCFALFSTGGVHGAEYNKRLYEADMKAWRKKADDMHYVKAIYPNPVDLRKAKTVTMKDGRVLPYKEFLMGGRKIELSEYKNLEKSKPKRLQKSEKGKMSLHPKYTYTSLAPANHEDFTSYYPNLLRMMEAFFNKGLGYDRYGEIFFQKEYYGYIMKEKNADLKKANVPKEKLEAYQKLRHNCGLTIDEWLISDEERKLYNNMRNGTKLILNSASGAADAKFQNNIRVNNQIIAMRIIG